LGVGWLGIRDGNWCLLSSSPFAWSNTYGFSIVIAASFDDVEVIGDISWGTEVMIWDQGLSVTPHAFSFRDAHVLDIVLQAVLHHGGGGGAGHVNGVAELFGEEWSLT